MIKHIETSFAKNRDLENPEIARGRRNPFAIARNCSGARSRCKWKAHPALANGGLKVAAAAFTPGIAVSSWHPMDATRFRSAHKQNCLTRPRQTRPRTSVVASFKSIEPGTSCLTGHNSAMG